MNDSIFDPQAMLDMTLDSPTEKRPPLPVGDYTAVIGDINARKWQGKQDPSKSGIAWDVQLTVQIPFEVQQSLGVEVNELKLSDSIMLDMLPNGSIDNSVGKNSRLRMYREAVDMNKPGDSFSARKMTGQVILVRIGHEEYNGNIMERVQKVARSI